MDSNRLNLGEYISVCVFQKVCECQHIMRKWNAIGVSDKVLQSMTRKGIHLVRIILTSENEPAMVYYATVRQYYKSELSCTNPLVPGDLQKFVRIEDMVRQV